MIERNALTTKKKIGSFFMKNKKVQKNSCEKFTNVVLQAFVLVTVFLFIACTLPAQSGGGRTFYEKYIIPSRIESIAIVPSNLHLPKIRTVGFNELKKLRDKKINN